MLFKSGTLYLNTTFGNINIILKIEVVNQDYSFVWILNDTGKIMKLPIDNLVLNGNNLNSYSWLKII